MSDSDDEVQARALGEALASLRHARGMSQAEAGGRIGMTSQAWGLYEAGRRPGLFRPDVQRRLTGALGLSPEALALEIVRSGGDGPRPPERRVAERGRSFSDKAPPSSGAGRRTLQLSHDDLAPWAGSGVTLVYDEALWPRRDQGCVVHTDEGVQVGLYDRGDAGAIHLRDAGGRERRIARADIRSLGAVVARLDGVAWPE